ncbi:MFS transporter [Nocardia vaccinii]|uniref:MFS transporter n=1 Tax=Nocardia vaccinii TaxID=1822 RepID=UPI0008309281|nr:MFS transporter [Nocardia vaccinii]
MTPTNRPPTARPLPELPSTGVMVVNIISGPASLATWIRDSFRAALSTLDGVAGLREFQLVRVASSEPAVFASITVWNAIEDFRAWRASPAFREAHPDRALYQKEFGELLAVQEEYPIDPRTVGVDPGAATMRRLSAEHPELIPADGQLVYEVLWSRSANRTRTPRKAGILAIACVATFMGFLDTAIVNMTYSSMAAQFPSPGSQLTWVISGYAVAFAALLTAAGRWADTFGHRRVLLWGVTGFAVTSLVCALAPTADVLIAGRIGQGATAALVLPAALGALLASVPADRAASAIGAWAATGALAAAIGPAVGAALVSLSGWRAIFLINVPVSVVLLPLGVMVLPRAPGRRRGQPDLIGVAALCAGIAALVAALTQGHEWGGMTSLPVIVLIVAGVAGCGLACSRGHTHARPALPVRLWRSAPYALSTVVNTGLGFVMGVFLLAIPVFLQQIWRLTLLQTAGCIGVIGFVAMASAGICGRGAVARRAGWMCAGGMVAVAAVCAVCASQTFSTTRDLPLWWPLAAVLGVGVGVTVTALSIITAATVPTSDISTGLGMGLASRQAGSALGVAVLAAMLASDANHLEYVESIHRLFAVTAVVVLVAALLAVAIRLPTSSQVRPAKHDRPPRGPHPVAPPSPARSEK